MPLSSGELQRVVSMGGSGNATVSRSHRHAFTLAPGPGLFLQDQGLGGSLRKPWTLGGDAKGWDLCAESASPLSCGQGASP